MLKYTTGFIYSISFIISILIYICIQFLYSSYSNLSKMTTFKAGFTTEQQYLNQENFQKQENIQNNIEIEEKVTSDIDIKSQDYSWYLEIPQIELKAEIAEGTSKEIMDDFIGHFEETKKQEGNIGLAAHNRGYKNNYFARLKELKNGDNIFYYYKGEKREYTVEENCIIKDTDWSYLEETKENAITLITCVENEPNYRRCIRGIQK